MPCLLSVVPRGYLPWLCGGLEITAGALLEQLADLPVRGHLAAALPATPPSLSARLVRKIAGPYRRTYRVRRHQVHTDMFHPVDLHALAARLKPAALVCHVSGIDTVAKMVELDLPTLFYVHDATIGNLFTNVRRMRVRRFAAESTFIAQRLAQATGERVEIIRPPMTPEDYRVEAGGDAILVVNPHPLKGGRMVAEIARVLPHRHFIVAGGWASTRHDPDVIEIEHALAALPNVERVGHFDDMRLAFGRSRCLLMPCVVEEAYGRTAAEALIAGIPVLASNRGALPETVGAGGVTLPPDAPVRAWTENLELMFTDNALHARLVLAARRQAAEPSRQPGHIGRQFAALVDELLIAGGDRR